MKRRAAVRGGVTPEDTTAKTPRAGRKEEGGPCARLPSFMSLAPWRFRWPGPGAFLPSSPPRSARPTSHETAWRHRPDEFTGRRGDGEILIFSEISASPRLPASLFIWSGRVPRAATPRERFYLADHRAGARPASHETARRRRRSHGFTGRSEDGKGRNLNYQNLPAFPPSCSSGLACTLVWRSRARCASPPPRAKVARGDARWSRS